MTKNNSAVASVDRGLYVEGLSKIIYDHVKRGFEPYIATFLFRSLCGSESSNKTVMESEVCRVYGRFITEVIRNPWSAKNADNKPVLIGCPDWPVYKKRKVKNHSMVGSGVHFGSVLLVPPFNRLKTGVKEHFESRECSYARNDGLLQRIHIEHIEDDIGRVVDYTFKALKRGRCGTEDLMVLPRARAERC